jgi:uncharacterized protein with PIN domain
MTRLLCDAMLGKLATYLRMCGYDTAYALDRDVEDADAILAWAREEDRTLLTRNATLAERAPDAIHLEAHDPDAQLAELQEAGIDLSLPDEPQRCSQCNGPVTRAGGDEPRPDYAPSSDEGPAWRCEECGQFYWKGSHWDDLASTLDTLDEA